MTATPAQQDGLLPYPASAARSSSRRPFRSAVLKAGLGPFGGDARWDFLKQRARTTNLAVLLLAGTACISLLLNVRMWLGNDVRHEPFHPKGRLLTSDSFLQVFRRPEDYRVQVPLSIRATLQSPHASLRHLVMVHCCRPVRLESVRLTFRTASVCRSPATPSGKAATPRMRRKTRTGSSSQCSEADRFELTSNTSRKGASSCAQRPLRQPN